MQVDAYGFTRRRLAQIAMDTLRKERDKWKARAELLEKKLSDLKSEHDICRTLLSDALASLNAAQQSRREESDDGAMGGSEMQHDSEDDNEDDSESSSDLSESSDSSPYRKRKKGKGKKRKNKKEEKAKKSKHRSRQRALASLNAAQQSRREESDDGAMGGSEMQHDSEDDSEDDSESSSDLSESSDSSPYRKRKKGKGKKRKNKKEEKAKKSKHRSRQRVGGPGDVVTRYKEVLAIFKTGKNMAKSFEKYGVDRLTIVKTAAIAELAIAAPEEYDQVEKGGTVADFAKRCEEVIKANQVISAKINKMKDDRKLLCITKKV